MPDKSTSTENMPSLEEKIDKLIPDNITSVQKTYFLLFKGHAEIIRQFTRAAYLYSKEILSLEQTGGHEDELEWLKTVRDNIIDNVDEHNGIAFMLSKLNELENNKK